MEGGRESVFIDAIAAAADMDIEEDGGMVGVWRPGSCLRTKGCCCCCCWIIICC